MAFEIAQGVARLVADDSALQAGLRKAQGNFRAVLAQMDADRQRWQQQANVATSLGFDVKSGSVQKAIGIAARQAQTAGGGAFSALGDVLMQPLEGIGGAIGGLWKSSGLIAAGALAGGLAFSTKEAIGLESAFVGIQKAAGLPADQFGQVQAGIKAMATDASLAGVSLDELLTIAQTGAKLGIAEQGGPQALLEYTRALAMTSIAMDDLPIGQVAESMGQILGVFGAGADKALSFSSVVDHLADSTTASAAGIFDVTSRLSGMAAPLGLTIPETAALATAVLDMGTNAEAAGSNLTRILGVMATAPAPFAALAGMSEQAFVALRDTSPLQALQATLGGLSQLQGAARFEAIKELGIDGVLAQQVMLGLAQKIQAIGPLVATANSEWQTHAQVLESVRMNSETTEAQLTALWNQFRLTAAELGAAFLPAIKEATPALAELGSELARVFVENRDTIKGFASGAVAALNSVIAALGKAGEAWDAVRSTSIGRAVTTGALPAIPEIGKYVGEKVFGKPEDILGRVVPSDRSRFGTEMVGETPLVPSSPFDPLGTRARIAARRAMMPAPAPTGPETYGVTGLTPDVTAELKKRQDRQSLGLRTDLAEIETQNAKRRQELLAQGGGPKRSILDISPDTPMGALRGMATQNLADLRAAPDLTAQRMPVQTPQITSAVDFADQALKAAVAGGAKDPIVEKQAETNGILKSILESQKRAEEKGKRDRDRYTARFS